MNREVVEMGRPRGTRWKRWPGKALAVSLLLLMSVLAVWVISSPPAGAADYPDVSVLVSGPEYVAVNSTVQYKITVAGGPAEVADEGDGWWTYSARVEYENKTGNPGVEPMSGNSTGGVFTLNLTAPATVQTITLVVRGTSETIGGLEEDGEKRLEIHIVKPVVLSATVKNTGSIRMEDVPVVFYVDGEEVDTVRVSLDPGEEKVVSVNWTKYDKGKHNIQVVVDPEGRFPDVSLEDNTAVSHVNVGEFHNWLNWVYALILITMAFLVYGKVREAKRPKRTKKW
ncbi:MAG: hypothetical protein J7L61_03200 [Thermoplasmata archaeon]|nr:hypothetical protein [Thermoplasmata archaeon]